MAPAQPSYRQPTATPSPVKLNRLKCISTARRVKPAVRSHHRADEFPVARDQSSQCSSQHRHLADPLAVGRIAIRHTAPPCRRSKVRTTTSSSAANSACLAVAAWGLARNTSRLPLGRLCRYPDGQVTQATFDLVAYHRRADRAAHDETDSGRLIDIGPDAQMPGQQGLARPAAFLDGCGEVRFAPHPRGRGKHRTPPSPRRRDAGQTLTRARPLRRRAASTARPARVRMRSLNPCVFARRRLFGWNVRLLTSTPVHVNVQRQGFGAYGQRSTQPTRSR